MATVDLAVVGTAIAVLLFLLRLGSVLVELQARLVKLEINQVYMREQLDFLTRKT